MSSAALMVCCVFFFQAEDGIRDLVRSRGLGDVYKRQVYYLSLTALFLLLNIVSLDSQRWSQGDNTLAYRRNWLTMTGLVAVSYTHLTLPTSDLV